MGWPDHGVPTESDHEVIQSLIDRMALSYTKSKGIYKTVVHCRLVLGKKKMILFAFDLF